MKALFTTLLLACSFLSFSQEEVSRYSMGYFGKEYSISAGEPNEKGNYTFYIDASPQKTYDESISVMLENKNLESFYTYLDSVKVKYAKWKETAVANGIKELDKEMKLPKVKLSVAFLYASKWKFTYNIPIKTRFKIINDKCLLIMSNKYELVSSSNQFMKNDGFHVVFNSVEEIEGFKKSISHDLVKNHFNKKSSKEDLFR